MGLVSDLNLRFYEGRINGNKTWRPTDRVNIEQSASGRLEGRVLQYVKAGHQIRVSVLRQQRFVSIVVYYCALLCTFLWYISLLTGQLTNCVGAVLTHKKCTENNFRRNLIQASPPNSRQGGVLCMCNATKKRSKSKQDGIKLEMSFGSLTTQAGLACASPGENIANVCSLNSP